MNAIEVRTQMPQHEVSPHYLNALLQGVNTTTQHIGGVTSVWRRGKSGIGRNGRLACNQSWRSSHCVATWCSC